MWIAVKCTPPRCGLGRTQDSGLATSELRQDSIPEIISDIEDEILQPLYSDFHIERLNMGHVIDERGHLSVPLVYYSTAPR